MEIKNLAIDPKKLTKNPWNTNMVDPENQTKLDNSVKRFGMFKPIICRELANGALQILGGEHRVESAVRLGFKEIPIINLGKISDEKAKEISLVDNGRYGIDDTLQLAELLKELGEFEDISSYMPYSDDDLNSIFSSTSISLDELELPDSDELPLLPTSSKVQTHQIMRFKVPMEDAAAVQSVIESIMKTQGFMDDDSLMNAGNALVYLVTNDE
ncbi:Spo0J Stage 0 sporulation protein J (antagonist of Soj) containing ParB-like nuclease domain [uncultured Caudovirales phage]|uniref:Spo0J Stage 0 sporulation protein J (Antagonist of Soj) containing ParB-like nuclease domain n=1 Tax=uncultured Caudovirales phage TaxID=2100421 RepID=A0A6J5KPC1_9CAUD|nr:Spo0J Stage 0 sporulation protein J (antagonist of Soj) containing ParB-like nuclease domain [uncultured Caudovirales phage]CAB4123669.1 Spo0J Stage 0 sporulation protein J (antagonist of Soj) containing ParB-like nuclease domain [uncultured Caudovirales phage]CAB5218996.1 Spo0J Stage 0 sporulation protein J (antagonist of Soj) containing ParB-like nuclease domain [uncultured Caudovirales phage]